MYINIAKQSCYIELLSNLFNTLVSKIAKQKYRAPYHKSGSVFQHLRYTSCCTSDISFEGFVDSEGWFIVKSESENEYTDYVFEYAPYRELNEILKGITLAN